MTARGATAAAIAQMEAHQNKPFHLFKGEFESGTLYLTDALGTLTWDGQAYTGVGRFISYEDLEENTDLGVTETSVNFTGVPDDIMSIFINENIVKRLVTIYRGFYDSSMAIVLDPFIIFKGRINDGDYSEDPESGKAAIRLRCSSKLIDFDKVKGRLTNTASQRQYYPEDKGFNFVPGLGEKIIVWKPKN